MQEQQKTVAGACDKIAAQYEEYAASVSLILGDEDNVTRRGVLEYTVAFNAAVQLRNYVLVLKRAMAALVEGSPTLEEIVAGLRKDELGQAERGTLPELLEGLRHEPETIWNLLWGAEDSYHILRTDFYALVSEGVGVRSREVAILALNGSFNDL